jgi:hypothetical protein
VFILYMFAIKPFVKPINNRITLACHICLFATQATMTGYSSTDPSFLSLIDSIIIQGLFFFVLALFFFVLFTSWYKVYRKLFFSQLDHLPFNKNNKKRIYLDDD